MKQFLTATCRTLPVSSWNPGRTRRGAGAHHVRVSLLVEDADVLELDVEEPGRPCELETRREMRGDVLVDGLERADDGQVVLELDGDLLVGERLEDGEDELRRGSRSATRGSASHRQPAAVPS